SVAQYAGLAAWDFDTTGIVSEYKRKRDRLVDALSGNYEFVKPGGAFYLFAKTPRGTGNEFVSAAVKENLLLISGSIFSRRDTHFRISYAATDQTLEKGIEILLSLAENRA